MAISKRTRFEVFKRDKFTCQYCGAKAPDVVLQVDHVHPKSKGGKDDLLNLVTSCRSCNSGKGARTLSDDSAVARQRAQLEELQERQEQIQMMLEWQRSLVDLDGQTVDAAAQFWCELVDWFDLTDAARLELRKVIRKFGLNATMDAMRAAVETYVKLDEDGKPTEESANRAFEKIGGICRVRAAEAEKPWLRNALYIRGILRNTLSYVDERYAFELLCDAFESGGDPEWLQKRARQGGSWTGWKEDMWDYIEQLNSGGAEDA